MAIKSTITKFTTNKIGGLINKGINNLVTDRVGDKFALKNSTEKFIYPLDLLGNDQYGELIKFTAYDVRFKPKDTKPKPKKKNTIETNKTTSSINNAKKIRYAKAGDFTSSTAQKAKQADIYLYVPAQGMINSTQIDWETKETSSIARSDFSSIAAAAKAGSQIAKTGFKNIIRGAGGKIVETAFKDSGELLANNIESFFTGMGLRRWNFAFEFAPRNEKELTVALDICRTFKSLSLPTTTAAHEFKYPAAWSFAIHSARNNELGNELPLMGCKKCYITNTTMNMSPESVWSTFGNGQPVAFNLTIGVVEDSILDRKEYDNAGYEL